MKTAQLALALAALACCTPAPASPVAVDVYQTAEVGTNGAAVTGAMLNAASHGQGYWRVEGVVKNSAGPYLRSHSVDNGVSTYSPKIYINRHKTYWVNLHFDGFAGECSAMVFDPETWQQVGNTVTCGATKGSKVMGRALLGRGQVGTFETTSATWFDHILIDVTAARFPIFPLQQSTNDVPATPRGFGVDGVQD